MVKKIYRFWIVLLVISGGIACWYSVHALKEVWNYMQLDGQGAATVLKWEVRELGSSRFAIAAEYSYELGGVSHTGYTIFKKYQFPNRFAAENGLKSLVDKQFRVWYREKAPSISSLEREFPQKYCLHALLTVGVFAYFYFTRASLSKFSLGSN